jgi:hypothetical protein
MLIAQHDEYSSCRVVFCAIQVEEGLLVNTPMAAIEVPVVSIRRFAESMEVDRDACILGVATNQQSMEV